MEYKRIDSFDKTENTFCYIETLQEYSDIFKLGEKAIITRGAGLSYCNASFAKDSTSINMPGFNRIFNFDNIKGRITLECGVTAGEVNNFLHFKEWMLPVLPGYPSITIGGCFAFNVHGKG